jgi:hypothetical protein
MGIWSARHWQGAFLSCSGNRGAAFNTRMPSLALDMFYVLHSCGCEACRTEQAGEIRRIDSDNLDGGDDWLPILG